MKGSINSATDPPYRVEYELPGFSYKIDFTIPFILRRKEDFPYWYCLLLDQIPRRYRYPFQEYFVHESCSKEEGEKYMKTLPKETQKKLRENLQDLIDLLCEHGVTFFMELRVSHFEPGPWIRQLCKYCLELDASSFANLLITYNDFYSERFDPDSDQCELVYSFVHSFHWTPIEMFLMKKMDDTSHEPEWHVKQYFDYLESKSSMIDLRERFWKIHKTGPSIWTGYITTYDRLTTYTSRTGKPKFRAIRSIRKERQHNGGNRSKNKRRFKRKRLH